MLKSTSLLSTLILIFILLSGCATKPVPRLELLTKSELSNWEEKIFNHQTHYSTGEDNDRQFIKAESKASASALYRYINVDLNKTPYLHWSWCIENTLGQLNEKSREGDDFAARVYVLVSPLPFSIRPRSINYVWSNTSAINETWESPYSEHVRMVAVRSGQTSIGQWHNEKRNLKTDLKLLFKEDNPSVLGIAIMSDTDNSKTSARAYYADIYFSKD